MKQQQMSKDEMLSMMDSMESTQLDVLSVSRPPGWLSLFYSVMVGVISMSLVLSSNNSLWTFISIVSIMVFFIALGLWGLRLYVLGIKLKMLSATVLGKVATLLISMLFTLVILIAKTLFIGGYTWLPAIAGLINFSASLYLFLVYLHRHNGYKGNAI